MNLVAPSPKSTMSSDSFDSLTSESSLSFDRLNPLRPVRTLQPVLQVLRSHYPTGCLSAELLQVVQDQFVVQAKVQVDGVAIVTALASASSVEVAEDRARTRALESIGLSTMPALNHALTPSLSATVSLMPEVVLPEVVLPAPEAIVAIEETVHETSSDSDISVELLDVEAPKITKTSTKRKTKTVAPVIEELAVAVEIEQSEPDALLESASELEGVEEIAPIAIEVPPVEVLQAVLSIDEPLAEEPLSESFEVAFEGGDVEYEYTFEEETAPDLVSIPMTVPPLPVTPDFGLDLADAIAQIGGEIDRIGWTKKQGSAYLQETYGKRTRAELTEAELFAFLSYLKSLPAKVQPDLSALPF